MTPKARCESMWARLKEELIYNRYNASKTTVEQLYGDISLVTGITEESAPPMEDYLQ